MNTNDPHQYATRKNIYLVCDSATAGKYVEHANNIFNDKHIKDYIKSLNLTTKESISIENVITNIKDKRAELEGTAEKISEISDKLNTDDLSFSDTIKEFKERNDNIKLNLNVLKDIYEYYILAILLKIKDLKKTNIEDAINNLNNEDYSKENIDLKTLDGEDGEDKIDYIDSEIFKTYLADDKNINTYRDLILKLVNKKLFLDTMIEKINIYISKYKSDDKYVDISTKEIIKLYNKITDLSWLNNNYNTLTHYFWEQCPIDVPIHSLDPLDISLIDDNVKNIINTNFYNCYQEINEL
jgi:hypothetical protein